EFLYRGENIRLHPLPNRAQNLLEQGPVIPDLHLEYLEPNNQPRNRSLDERDQRRGEPVCNHLNREHDSVPGDLDYVPQPFSASNNTIPNGLHNRPQNVAEPITNRSHSNLNSRPRRVNTITEPANLLVHENKPSNKKRHGGNNQTNRVSLHRRIKNAHLHSRASSS